MKKLAILLSTVPDGKDGESTFIMGCRDEPILIPDNDNTSFVGDGVRFFPFVFDDMFPPSNEIFQCAFRLFIPRPESLVQSKEQTVFQVTVEIAELITSVGSEEKMSAQERPDSLNESVFAGPFRPSKHECDERLLPRKLNEVSTVSEEPSV